MSLEDFAASDPSWEDLKKLANEISLKYVAHRDISTSRIQSEANRDQQNENMLLRNQYLLLYDEMSCGLNNGDMGRVEDLYFPWMYIFRGCGKHKYAAEMWRYLENMHFNYPPALRCAIISICLIRCLTHLEAPLYG